MKFIEYMSRYRQHWKAVRIARKTSRKKPENMRPSQLHGKEFRDWFDAEFGLKGT